MGSHSGNLVLAQPEDGARHSDGERIEASIAKSRKVFINASI
jgi:hypothetical protein